MWDLPGPGLECPLNWQVDSFFFFFLFIYFWLRWVFVAARGLSPVAASGGYSSLQCADFSLRWPFLLQSTSSRSVGFSSCGSQAPERRLSSCGPRASLLRGMWDLPGPGLEPMSPALAGGFSTTAPPGKPGRWILNHYTSRAVPVFRFVFLTNSKYKV